MADLRMFIPLTKVDIEKRLVYGIATAEEADLSGEVCDYASTKGHYEKWSEGVKKASGGKSLGNLRAMHGPIAAGKVMDISFDDAGKKIEICAKVVDDGEWNKVREGVYTGFSQGGSYAKRWTDAETGLTHYTASPTEVSLVDLPCLPSATFEMVKAEGVVEKHAFQPVIEEPEADAIKAEAEALAKAADDKRTWRYFTEQATLALMKRQVAAALVKLAPDSDAADIARNSGETLKALAAKTAQVVLPEPAKKRFEPAQFWGCGCSDHQHVTKAEAVGCMKKRANAESLARATAPIDSALAKLEAELGLGKAKVDPPAAKTGDAAAHEQAANAHRDAAAGHEALAAHKDMPAKDAAEHLAAAKAHKSAAKAHDAASDDPSSDNTQKAGALTQHAAAASDGAFGKAENAGDLAKSSDEARDGNGKWTAGGALEVASKVAHGVGVAAGVVGAGIAGAGVGGLMAGPVGAVAGGAYAAHRQIQHETAKKSARGGSLKKDLYSVSRFASIISDLSYLYNSVADEAIRENDASPLPAALKDQIKALSGSLVAMAQEETAELFGDGSGEGAYDAPAVLAMAAGLSEDARTALIKISEDVPGLKKVAGVLEEAQADAVNRTIDRFVTEMQALGKTGARNSAADTDRLQKAHDLLIELGAACPKTGTAAGNGQQDGEEVEKILAENDGLRKSVESTGARLDALVAKVAEIGARAAPARAAVRAIGKAEDVRDGTATTEGARPTPDDLAKRLAALPKDERDLIVMKAALSHPVAVIR